MTTSDFIIELDKKIDYLSNFMGTSHPDVVALRNKFNSLRSQNTNSPNQATSTIIASDPLILEQLKEIRAALNLRGSQVVKYDFLKNDNKYELLFKQLTVDSLRMENAVLKTFDESGHEIKPEQRLKSFCLYASFQVELLLNIFYSIKHGNDFEKFRLEYNNYEEKFKKDKFSKINTPKDNKPEYRSIQKDISLELKMRLFLNWSRSNPKVELLRNMLIAKDIRNGEVHRAAELGSNGFKIKSKMDNFTFDPNNFTFFTIIRNSLIEFVEEMSKTKIF